MTLSKAIGLITMLFTKNKEKKRSKIKQALEEYRELVKEQVLGFLSGKDVDDGVGERCILIRRNSSLETVEIILFKGRKPEDMKPENVIAVVGVEKDSNIKLIDLVVDIIVKD